MMIIDFLLPFVLGINLTTGISIPKDFSCTEVNSSYLMSPSGLQEINGTILSEDTVSLLQQNNLLALGIPKEHPLYNAEMDEQLKKRNEKAIYKYLGAKSFSRTVQSFFLLVEFEENEKHVRRFYMLNANGHVILSIAQIAYWESGLPSHITTVSEWSNNYLVIREVNYPDDIPDQDIAREEIVLKLKISDNAKMSCDIIRPSLLITN